VSGGYATLVFPSVLISQHGQINVRSANLLQINGVGPPVGSRQILKEKDVEEPSEERIIPEVVPNSLPFALHLFLYGTDEYL
jgi:hypothetical protein